MIINFTDNDIENKINIIEVEDIVFTAEQLEIQDAYYLATGKALIDGETYSNFVIEFTLIEEPKSKTCKDILEVDWDEYDFIFNN